MGEVKLLHLSDFHFFRRPNQREIRSLYKSSIVELFRLKDVNKNSFPSPLEQMNWWAGHVPHLADLVAKFVHKEKLGLDAIIITGDLATTGNADDLRAVMTYVDEKCSYGWRTQSDRPSLQSGNLPILLIPGNHDRYLNESGNAGGAEFEQIFKEYWLPSSRVNTFLLDTQKSGQIALIASDFALKENNDSGLPFFGKFGRGKAYDDIILELKNETKLVQESGCKAILWAMHFPPCHPKEESTLMLIDGKKIVDAAKECGISYILAGHVHKEIQYTIESANLGVFCAATSMATDDYGNSIHVITINLDNGVITNIDCNNHTYNIDTQDFVLTI